MQDELLAQLERVAEISGRIESILEDNADVDEEVDGDESAVSSITKICTC